MIGDDRFAGDMVVARRSLDRACHDLDAAVGALPYSSGDDVMANPRLVALLLRVVVARRYLAGVQAQDPSRWA